MFASADAAIAAAMGAGLSADNVTLTEADMNDPDLAAELAAVLGESVPTPKHRPAEPIHPLPEHGSDWDAALRQQIGAKKKLALQLKATDKKAAIHALREAKQLEATLKARKPPATARAAAPAAAPAPAAQLSLEAAMRVAVGGMAVGNPDSVTLSEADMHDPELLAELAAISGSPGPNPSILTTILTIPLALTLILALTRSKAAWSAMPVRAARHAAQLRHAVSAGRALPARGRGARSRRVGGRRPPRPCRRARPRRRRRRRRLHPAERRGCPRASGLMTS